MKPTDLSLALLANTLWAFNFIAAKAGTEHFPPLMFTALRFMVVLLLLAPFLNWIIGRMRQVLLIAFVLGVIHFGLIFIGVAAANDVSSVAIVAQLYVPFAALLAVPVLNESLDKQRFLGILVAFIGVMLIGFDPVVFNHLEAMFFIVGAALAMAIGTILMRQLHQVGILTLQAWIALIAVPCLSLLSWLFEGGQWNAWRSASWLDLSTPIYSAIGASIIGHGIVYYLLKRYPVSVTTPIMLLAPIVAVLFGVVLWHDQLTWKLITGGLLTLSGVAIVNLRWSQDSLKNSS